MAERDPKLQEQREDVETEGFSTEDEDNGVSTVYMLEGKAYAITRESTEALQTLKVLLHEGLSYAEDDVPNMSRIVDRAQTLMTTNFYNIKSSKKLRDKAKAFRTKIWRRITELQRDGTSCGTRGIRLHGSHSRGDCTDRHQR